MNDKSKKREVSIPFFMKHEDTINCDLNVLLDRYEQRHKVKLDRRENVLPDIQETLQHHLSRAHNYFECCEGSEFDNIQYMGWEDSSNEDSLDDLVLWGLDDILDDYVLEEVCEELTISKHEVKQITKEMEVA